MIRLYFYRDNFGDELSMYIIERLSSSRVVYRKPFRIKKFVFDYLRFFKGILLEGKIKYDLLKYSPFKKIIISIGSIIEESSKKTIVWGAGISSIKTKIVGGEFRAVRGKYTQARLRELNYRAPEIIGDPAILLPILYHVERKEGDENKRVGIVPHIVDYQDVLDFFKCYEVNDIKVIDLACRDVERVIDEICSCEKILSSSLHGLIVSHAYNIPALRFEKNRLEGDGVKFLDYFSSVEIKEYQPLQICLSTLLSLTYIKNFFEEYEEYSLPKKDIKLLQAGLLSIAPFKVRDEYFSKLN